MRRWLALPFAVALAGVWLVPAAAQESPGSDDAPRSVNISFDLGDFDTARGDWPVSTVIVDGDLDEGVDFTVELRGTGDRVIWSAVRAFTLPQTRIGTGEFIGVGDVTRAGISQALTLDPLLVQPELSENPVQGGGGSTGQVATSMVLVIIIAVILFRTPLPSASTQRWTA